MDGSGAPNLTLVPVTMAEVFEATNVLLAKMVRMEAHLNITLPCTPWSEPRNETPSDAFAQVSPLIEIPYVLAKTVAKEGYAGLGAVRSSAVPMPRKRRRRPGRWTGRTDIRRWPSWRSPTRSHQASGRR